MKKMLLLILSVAFIILILFYFGIVFFSEPDRISMSVGQFKELQWPSCMDNPEPVLIKPFPFTNLVIAIKNGPWQQLMKTKPFFFMTTIPM